MAYMKRIVCREGEQEGDNKYWEDNRRIPKPKHKDTRKRGIEYNSLCRLAMNIKHFVCGYNV